MKTAARPRSELAAELWRQNLAALRTFLDSGGERPGFVAKRCRMNTERLRCLLDGALPSRAESAALDRFLSDDDIDGD